jgi:hypothetical protein
MIGCALNIASVHRGAASELLECVRSYKYMLRESRWAALVSGVLLT